MKTRTWIIVFSMTIALLLSACTIQFATNVDKSGSGQIRVEMGYTEEEATMLENMGAGVSGDLCEEMKTEVDSADAPEGAEYYSEQRGDETWCGFKVPFADLEELKGLYSDMDMEVNEISLTDGKFVYDIDVDATGGEDFAFFPIKLKWQMTVPGTVGDNNADEVDGNTLTWNLSTNSNNNIHVESTVAPDWIWWAVGIGLACLCVIFVVAAGVGIFFLVRRNKAAPAPVSAE
jgi:hypothetical protein